jgi:large subunit ribosomal protein L10
MTKDQKSQEIAELKEVFSNAQYFYITDSSTLSVEAINKFRRLCFSKGIQYRVAKNTLIRKALEQVSDTRYTDLYPVLNGPSGVMFSTDGSTPAKLLKEFREKHSKPVLKGAYIDSDIFIGDMINELSALKSKSELIGEVIGLLQSPMSNLMGALQGGQKIASLLKALEERG